MSETKSAVNLETRSRLIHWAFWYDMKLKAFSFGREGKFREKFLDIAGIAPGEAVLDAGCGTGTMAIAASRRVGESGAVFAVDASPEMLARAGRKAARKGASVSIQPALLEALPFPDARFDVVITSFVLHHFPTDLLERCLSEIRRVLKADGRLVAFDFASSEHRHGFSFRHNHPHNTFDLYGITSQLNSAGLVVRERGAARFMNAAFIKATPGSSADQHELPEKNHPAGPHRGVASLALVAAIATWAVSMVAIALFIVGRKWLWFGTGTAATILAFHAATFHLGLGLGGTSMIGYVARWFHGAPGSSTKSA